MKLNAPTDYKPTSFCGGVYVHAMPKLPTTHQLLQAFSSSTVKVKPFFSDSPIVSVSEDLIFNDQDQSFYFYEKGCWKLIPTGDVRTGAVANFIDAFLVGEMPTANITTSKVVDFYHSLIRTFKTRLDQDYFTPYTALNDLTLNLHTLELVPHDPKLFCLHYLPFPSSALTKPTPFFDNYLESAFPDSPEMHTLIYEMIAYYLYPRTYEPATFFLYGVANSGKSTFLKFLTKIINDQFVSSFSLQSLTNNNTTVAELANKRVNILDEDESKHIQADKLKALVSNSPIEARRLYQQPFTFMPKTKFLFSSNQFPKLTNVDDGMERRLHFIEFKHRIQVKDIIPKLHEKLNAEMPGIIFKALTHGKAFLKRNQKFTRVQAMEETKQEFLLEASPVLRFVDEACVISEGPSTTNQTIYDHYVQWCENNGHKQVNSLNFHKQLSLNRKIKSSRKKKGRYKNLILRTDI